MLTSAIKQLPIICALCISLICEFKDYCILSVLFALIASIYWLYTAQKTNNFSFKKYFYIFKRNKKFSNPLKAR
jgi:hypothetical protein